MSTKKDERREEKVWRCPLQKAKKIFSIEKGRFSEGHNVSYQQFIEMVFIRPHETPVKTAAELTAISEQTYVPWYVYLRDVCSHSKSDTDR